MSIFGIPGVLTSNRAKVFTSKFWIIHRVSTDYNPRANKQAEIAVKSTNQLIRCNKSQTGTHHTDDLAKAILQHRNTTCPLQPGKFVLREEWHLAAHQRAMAHSKRRMLRVAQECSAGAAEQWLHQPVQPQHQHVQPQHLPTQP